jgi:hypothetical protein
MQVLDQLTAATRAALEAVGPRVVAALVVRQAAAYARPRGLDDEARVLNGFDADVRGLKAEAAAAHAHLGWPAIAEAFGISERQARARYGRAVEAAGQAAAQSRSTGPRPARDRE